MKAAIKTLELEIERLQKRRRLLDSDDTSPATHRHAMMIGPVIAELMAAITTLRTASPAPERDTEDAP